jgi:hypothetical protein
VQGTIGTSACSQSKCGTQLEENTQVFPPKLILLPTLLLTKALAREGLFGPAFLSRFHVVAVFLDFLDDILTLDFPLETPEGILQRFTLLNYNFSHANSPPFRSR